MRYQRRGPLPQEVPILANRPPPPDERTSLILKAWSQLGSERRVSLGYGIGVTGAIPWSKVVAWGKEHQLSRASRHLLVDVLCILDAERAAREASKRAHAAGAKT